MKYEQLVVIQGCTFTDKDKPYFYSIFKKHNFKRPKIVGTIITLPSLDESGNSIPGTGGRHDFFFFVNDKDIHRFSVWRFNYGMRWWEDIFYNKEEHIYPEDFRQKYPPRW